MTRISFCPHRPQQRRLLALTTVWMALVHNYMARFLPSILKAQLQDQFKLTDTESTTPAITFACIYAVFSVIFGYWADRGLNQTSLLFVSALVWSSATAYAASCQDFSCFVATQGIVAVAESAFLAVIPIWVCQVSTSTRTRSFIFGLMATADPIGKALAFSIGGELCNAFDWRITYLTTGLSGVILAPIVPLILTVTNRYHSAQTGDYQPIDSQVTITSDENTQQHSDTDNNNRGLTGTWRVLMKTSTKVVILCRILAVFGGSALIEWIAVFIERTFSTTQIHIRLEWVGYMLGNVYALSGVCGAFVGSLLPFWLVDQHGVSMNRALFGVAGFAFLIAAYFALLGLYSSTATQSIIFIGVSRAFLQTHDVPLKLMLVHNIPSRVRGVSLAFIKALVRLVANTLGPVVPALITAYGFDLKYALGCIPAAWFLAAGCSIAAAHYGFNGPKINAALTTTGRTMRASGESK